MSRFLLAFCAIALGFAVCSMPASANAQSLKASLFAEAEETMDAARNARADLLAPRSYGRALEHYNKAENKFNKGDSIEDIREELKRAVTYLKQALDATRLAEVTFTSVVQARSDAESALAPEHSKRSWERAEKKFVEAATELEKGDVNDARKKGAEAQEMFREAELAAIKSYLFGGTRKLHEQADRQDVGKYAPKTLKRSHDYLRQAEKALEDNRYDTDRPRILARDAMYEVRHAMYIAQFARNMEKDKTSLEDLVLASEAPLQRIAGTIDVVAEFDEGYDKATRSIIEYIENVETEAERLTAEVSDRRQRIIDLEKQIALLESKLGGATSEQQALKERMRAQEEAQARIEQIAKSFARSEARVFREGDEVIVRLVGMNFDVGQSTIRPEFFALLSKVEKVIESLPDSEVRVEGHTDSYGTDEANLTLSQQRAEAVRQYLLADMGAKAPKITSVGYGETRPIANNETKDGRARNRRIDIAIYPKL